jgi:hypothetical protein
MKSLHAVAAASLFAVGLLPSVSEVRAAGTESLVIACPATRLPSHADVVRVFDVHNFGKVFDLRQRVRAFAYRECMRGAGHIEIVATPDQRSSERLRLARR